MMKEWFRKNILNLYLILLGLHCWFILMGMDSLRYYSKLLLLPLLILAFLIKIPKRNKWNFLWFILPLFALIFSFAGDYLLTFKQDQYFLFGMISFMLTHIFNGIYFLSLNGIKLNKLKQALMAVWLTAVAGSLELYFIGEHLGAYYIPVLAYTILISIMLILTFNLLESDKYRHLASAYFIPGAGLFFLSDGMLALNKFSLEEPVLDIFVMLTYGLAQYFLVRGYYRVLRLKRQGKSSTDQG